MQTFDNNFEEKLSDHSDSQDEFNFSIVKSPVINLREKPSNKKDNSFELPMFKKNEPLRKLQQETLAKKSKLARKNHERNESMWNQNIQKIQDVATYYMRHSKNNRSFLKLLERRPTLMEQQLEQRSVTNSPSTMFADVSRYRFEADLSNRSIIPFIGCLNKQQSSTHRSNNRTVVMNGSFKETILADKFVDPQHVFG